MADGRPLTPPSAGSPSIVDTLRERLAAAENARQTYRGRTNVDPRNWTVELTLDEVRELLAVLGDDT